MNPEEARKYAERKFKELPEFLCQWNLLHVRYVIKAVKELAKGRNINLGKLEALAWVHDIGKIKSDENHAQHSVEILEKDFELDDIDRDCILEHGSSGKPKTQEGKIFRLADGLSLFYPEVILFRFYVESKEGLSFEEIKAKIKATYEKYLQAYSDSQPAILLLKEKYECFFLEI